ncbi:MAG: FAD:protein FMN transferase [Desulfuromonadales bacterium]
MLRWLYLLICGCGLLVMTTACRQEKPPDTLHLSGQTMGTTWSVVLLPSPDGTDTADLKKRLQDRLDQINRLMSTYDPESEISRFNELSSKDWFAVSPDTAQVIELSLEISRLTGGAFDISIGPLVELWGFGPGERRETAPDEQQIGEGLARVGYEKILLRRDPAAIRKQVPELHIDLSAIAKGYAVDALAEILRHQGIDNYLVEIGGELQVSGHRADGTPWRVAIEKPLEDNRDVAVIFPLTNTALATSGDYRNFFVENGQRYAHILDPSTGRPARHRLASVTVLDQTCARADALATALMVMGEETGRRFCEENHIAAYFLVHENESIAAYKSHEFPSYSEGDKQ